MARTNDLTSTEINLSASKCFSAFDYAHKQARRNPFWFEKKSADPGEWIDAFAFFYRPDAVLAKTVLIRGAHTRQFAESVFPRIN